MSTAFPTPLTLALAVGLLAGCAGGPGPDEGADDGYRGARLLGCTDYVPPPPSSGGAVRSLRVRAVFDISPTGEVGAVHVDHQPGVPAWVRDAARRAALSCRYEPALQDGEPVPSQGSRYFAFEVSG